MIQAPAFNHGKDDAGVNDDPDVSPVFWNVPTYTVKNSKVSFSVQMR